jgi:mannose-6-phosphate isomerase-like protein (cupin superfamily)
MTGQQLKITPHESVTVIRNEPGALEVEVTYGPGGKPPPTHYHPEQDERFEVLDGEMRVVVGDGDERSLHAGETLEVPRGTVHKMWNAGAEPARATWVTSPAGRTLEWFSSIDALYRSGRVRKGGQPGPLAFGALLSEFDDVFRLAVKPEPVVRAGLSVLGAVGRRRGYGEVKES